MQFPASFLLVAALFAVSVSAAGHRPVKPDGTPVPENAGGVVPGSKARPVKPVLLPPRRNVKVADFAENYQPWYKNGSPNPERDESFKNIVAGMQHARNNLNFNAVIANGVRGGLPVPGQASPVVHTHAFKTINLHQQQMPLTVTTSERHTLRPRPTQLQGTAKRGHAGNGLLQSPRLLAASQAGAPQTALIDVNIHQDLHPNGAGNASLGQPVQRQTVPPGNLFQQPPHLANGGSDPNAALLNINARKNLHSNGGNSPRGQHKQTQNLAPRQHSRPNDLRQQQVHHHIPPRVPPQRTHVSQKRLRVNIHSRRQSANDLQQSDSQTQQGQGSNSDDQQQSSTQLSNGKGKKKHGIPIALGFEGREFKRGIKKLFSR